MARSLTVTLVVLLAVFEFGSCIKCYQCNSEQDKSCSEQYTANPKHLVDCTSQDSLNYNKHYLYSVLPAEVFGSVVGAPRYCYRIKMGNGAVIRACLDANPNNMNQSCNVMNDVTKNFPADKKVSSCSVCATDMCNGASNVIFSYPLAFIATVVAFLASRQ